MLSLLVVQGLDDQAQFLNLSLNHLYLSNFLLNLLGLLRLDLSFGLLGLFGCLCERYQFFLQLRQLVH